MKHLDGVILDLDCVTVKFRHLQAEAWGKALAEQGLNVSVERVLALAGLNANELLSQMAPTTLSRELSQLIYERYRQILKASLGDKEIKVLPGTKELLEKWQEAGLHVAVISQALTQQLQTRLEEIQVDDMLLEAAFNFVATSQNNLNPIEAALKILACPVGRVMLVSGSPHYIRLALKLGISIIILQHPQLGPNFE